MIQLQKMILMMKWQTILLRKILWMSSRQTIQDNQMTDMDFFKSKIKKKWSDSESDDEDSGESVAPSVVPPESIAASPTSQIHFFLSSPDPFAHHLHRSSHRRPGSTSAVNKHKRTSVTPQVSYSTLNLYLHPIQGIQAWFSLKFKFKVFLLFQTKPFGPCLEKPLLGMQTWQTKFTFIHSFFRQETDLCRKVRSIQNS
jgi:hypothetical protein